MEKQPYTTPELIELGDVIEITQSQFQNTPLTDANYPNPQESPRWFTDNII